MEHPVTDTHFRYIRMYTYLLQQLLVILLEVYSPKHYKNLPNRSHHGEMPPKMNMYRELDRYAPRAMTSVQC